MTNIKPVIVYSALHTGTWFACHSINHSCQEHVAIISDKWCVNITGKPIESLRYPEGITNKLIQTLVNHEKNIGVEPFHEVLILQAHQRNNSRFWNLMMKSAPEVPVVVPTRDPLLSMNTRIWRDCKRLRNFQREDKYSREARAENQFMSIKRTLSIPPKNAYFLPIDISRTPEERAKIFKDIIGHCKLTLAEEVPDWAPVNSTVRQDKKYGEDFTFLKEAILNKDSGIIEKYLGLELRAAKRILGGSIPRMKALGYSDLYWW